MMEMDVLYDGGGCLVRWRWMSCMMEVDVLYDEGGWAGGGVRQLVAIL